MEWYEKLQLPKTGVYKTKFDLELTPEEICYANVFGLPELTAKKSRIKDKDKIGAYNKNIQKEALALVADFYVLNYLWFNSGRGKTAYGYKLSDEDALIPEAIGKRYELELDATAERLRAALTCGLERSIRAELLHADIHMQTRLYDYERSGILSSGSSITLYEMKLNKEQWDAQFPNKQMAKEFNPFTCDIQQAKQLFKEEKVVGLESKWNASYGGDLWAKACQSLIELQSLPEKLPITRLVVEIDKILDLKHNTGQVLDKTEFCSVDTAFLDHRAATTDMGSLLPVCSDNVNKLVRKTNHYVKLNLPDTKTYEYSVACWERGGSDAPIPMYYALLTKEAVEAAHTTMKAQQFSEQDVTFVMAGLSNELSVRKETIALKVMKEMFAKKKVLPSAAFIPANCKHLGAFALDVEMPQQLVPMNL